jgi:hypothetical protein
VYADWLDERGERERSEFIRVQIELARLGKKRANSSYAAAPTHRCSVCHALWVEWPNDGGWSLCSPDCEQCCDNVAMGEQIVLLPPAEVGLYQRERELLEANGRQWASPLCNLVNWMAPINGCQLHWLGNVLLKWRWTRGFVSSVSLSCDKFLGDSKKPDRAAALFRLAPIERVEFLDKSPGIHTHYIAVWNLGEAGNYIPLPLFEGLRRYSKDHSWKTVRLYEFEHVAVDDLSDSAVKLGRSLAGLDEDVADQLVY